MPVEDDIMRLLCHFSLEKKMKAAVKHSKRGAVAAGTGALVGGLLGGPLGIAVGGSLGSVIGAWMAKGQFQPIPEMLMELTPKQKKELCKQIFAIIKNVDWSDASHLIMLIKKNAALQQRLTAALISYMKQELKVEIQYGHPEPLDIPSRVTSQAKRQQSRMPSQATRQQIYDIVGDEESNTETEIQEPCDVLLDVPRNYLGRSL